LFIIKFLVQLYLYLQNASTIKLTNFVCVNYNKSLTLVHECRLRAINRNKTILNFNGTILHPVYNIEVVGQILKRENGYKPWLYKFTIDACKFLKNPYNPIVLLFYKILKPYTNMNHTCPYVVSKQQQKKCIHLKILFLLKGPQIVKGYELQYEKLRLPWPSGEFMWQIDWLTENKPMYSTNMYWVVNET